MNNFLDDIKTDQELRPLFLDFLSKNIILGMTDVFTVKSVDRIRIQKDFYSSLFLLSERLNAHVPNEMIHSTIEEVSKYYLSKMGRISFDQYPSSN